MTLTDDIEINSSLKYLVAYTLNLLFHEPAFSVNKLKANNGL